MCLCVEIVAACRLIDFDSETKGAPETFFPDQLILGLLSIFQISPQRQTTTTTTVVLSENLEFRVQSN